MTFTEAAAEVLRLVGKPLHYKEITEIAIEKNLLSHVGKSPEVTMGARLAALLKKSVKENPLVRVKPGVFALRDWDDKGAKPDADKGATEAGEPVATPAVEASEPAEKAAEERGPEEPEEEIEQAPDDKMRAEIAAAGAELFGEEDDDDQPIFGGEDEAVPGAAPAGESSSGRRRRRRRRRRPNGEPGGATVASGLPSYTETPAFGAGAPPVPELEREREREREAPTRVLDAAPSDQPPLDDLGGRELADSIAFLLNTFDRNGGTVALRQLAENAQRRGRVVGDVQQVQAQVAAAVRADNARRAANGQRVRFRIVGGRVALTDWLLGGELARLEADACAAVERYREAGRRTLLRKLQELPGHAIVELVLLALDRIGISQLRAVKRPGMPGGESHFSGVQKSGFGEVRTAIVIRRDGREIGRERVADLRGSLHHYGPAAAGWMITTGQVLSGAREESATSNAAPIALCDGIALARLCEDHGIAVLRAQMPISVPDVDFLEALRAT